MKDGYYWIDGGGSIVEVTGEYVYAFASEVPHPITDYADRFCGGPLTYSAGHWSFCQFGDHVIATGP